MKAGKKQPAAPADCRVTHNAFLPGKWEIARLLAAPEDFHWSANVFQTDKVRKNPVAAFTRFNDAELNFERRSGGLLGLTASSAVHADSPSAIKADIDGARRAGKAVCGCDVPGPDVRTGPTWR